MKRIVQGIILIVLFHLHSGAQQRTPDSLQARIILIGDAGQLTNGRHPVVAGVRSTIPMDKKTTIIYLGDNLYKEGLPDDVVPDYNLAKAPLDSQIVIAKGTDAKVYFLPGNHDWNNGGPHGWETIQREQYYIDILGDKNINFYPKDGCPGPVEIKITDDVTLIIMDSQWWVHPYDKPGIESDCPYKTKAEVLTQLDDLLSRNSKKLVIFALHHTLRSYGIHGGYFKLKQHIFPLTEYFPKLYIPLPIIGSIYPITRGIFGTAEDMKHPAYTDLVTELDKVLKTHENVIRVAGHEHTLQLIKDSSAYYVVSGSGSKSNRVSKSRKSLFATDQNGFATLDITKDKNVSISFYTVDSGKVKEAYATHLLNFTGLPPKPEDTLREVEVAFKDSVIISASDKYKNPTGFRKTFLGKNYREEWSVPVQFKVFNIRREKGGFKIESLGGGKQTKSLRLTDRRGKEWTLRSVEKDPEKAVPENLRGTLAQDIVQDLISASHPYAPLVVPGLAKATGVLTTDPQFFYVPDDPAFGIYQKMFANTVCLLEERDPTPDGSTTKSTAKIINNLIEDHDNHVDQQEYLRGRLLDNVIGDWDRHFDQWKWGTRDTGKGKLYYPVPRDRDQAFFNSDGMLLNYLSKNQFKYLQGFKKSYYSVKWLNWEARDQDRIFLNLLTENDWKKIIDTFQHKLTDNVIDSSVKKLPPEIYPLDVVNISSKLKSRRDVLMKEGLRLYNYLTRRVNIIGSNKQEIFKVQRADSGIQVTVLKKNSKNDITGIMYQRTFSPAKTKELRLYGLNGNDRFEIDEDVSSKMKIRLIGGKGNDTFDLKGNIRNYVYDITTSDTSMKLEQNYVANHNKSKILFSSNPLVNEYKPYGYTYNTYRFPQLNIGYNPEDKLMMGIGFSATTHGGFRKEPYSTFQKLSTLYAFTHKAYQVRYQGIFNSVIQGNKDLLINAEFVNPTLNNFFGFGNETPRDASKPVEFYRVRYKYVQTDLLVRKRMNDFLDISIGPSYYHYWNKYEDNKTRILANPAVIGSDSASVYATKDYLGGKLKMDINFVNNELLPTRGIQWYSELSSMYGLNNRSKNLTRITTDMTVYASLSEARKLMGILRVGGGHIFSKHFEYFQALNLGANNYVRGFRKDRFSGSGLLYSSFEVRVKLFKSEFYILPGDVGVIGFYDVGKIWMKGQDSRKWHQSYGGGLYYSPFNIVIVSATVGVSDEDNLLNFSLGTKFRLTF